MKLIFIYGLPATGKLTVAVELAAMTGYKLFHNHLVVDLLCRSSTSAARRLSSCGKISGCQSLSRLAAASCRD